MWALLCAVVFTWAQEPVQDRFGFAEMYVGVDARLLAAQLEDTASSAQEPWSSVTPRIWIGGMHFWGHADFYVAFGLPLSVTSGGPSTGASLTQSVETGARVYPWALRRGSVRPWLGVGWAPLGYRQADVALGTGPWAEQHGLHLSGGVTGRWGPHQIELGVGWIPSQVTYPVDLTRTERLDLSPITASIAYKFAFDTTAGARPHVASGGVAAREADLQERKLLSGLSVAAGVSSAFTLGPDPGDFRYAGGPSGAILADVAIGYYNHPWDAAVRLSWRRIGQATSGYGASRTWVRQAFSLDVFKMLFDYQGFVPFVGPGVSANYLTYQDPNTLAANWVFTPEVIVGWDIRPTRVQSWLLRTNLRVAPFLTLSGDNTKQTFRHLEFNFIQFVLYPGRLFRKSTNQGTNHRPPQ